MKTLIQIADVLSIETAASYGTQSAANGATVVTVGVAETGEVISSNAEYWHPPGLLSIPALPNAVDNNTDCSQVVLFSDRYDQDVILAHRDTRIELLAGNINPGETVLYNSGNARVALKNDDTINIITTDAGATAPNAKLQFTIAPTGITIMASFGSLIFDATGFHITTLSGASFNMGAISSSFLPGPLSALTSFCTLSAGTVNVAGTAVMLGLAVADYAQIAVSPLPVPYLTPFTIANPPVACSNVYVGLA